MVMVFSMIESTMADPKSNTAGSVRVNKYVHVHVHMYTYQMISEITQEERGVIHTEMILQNSLIWRRNTQ